jgi:glucose-1-phosphate thymidylyltransferase
MMHDAGSFVRTITERQGLYVGSPDEIAYNFNYIDRNKLKENIEPYSNSGYVSYLIGESD